MILFDEQGFEIKVRKASVPAINNGKWSPIMIRIDEDKYEFYFSKRSNSKKLYFKFNDCCFSIPAYDENIGYLTDRRPDLYTRKPTWLSR